MDEKGYIKKDRGAIRLLKRKELLDAWAEEYRFAQINDLKFYYSLARNFDEYAVKLKGLPKNLRENYCLTMFAGASLVAPQVRFNEIHLFVRGDLNEWVKTLDINPVIRAQMSFWLSPLTMEFFMLVRRSMVYLQLLTFNFTWTSII